MGEKRTPFKKGAGTKPVPKFASNKTTRPKNPTWMKDKTKRKH